MRLERFVGPDTATIFQQARFALGEDAIVLRTIVHRGAAFHERVEIVAAIAADVDRFRTRLTPAPLVALDGRARIARRPLTLAVVGPSGAGKTTLLARLATHASAFAEWRVGVIALTGERRGALEQLRALLPGVALEALTDAAEIRGAMKRLSKCDVVLVDTPALAPRTGSVSERWQATLAALAPDEVHLVLPAALRPDLAAGVRSAYRALGATHVALTKLDELPGDEGIAELAGAIALPMRWATDDAATATLQRGAPRVLAALGQPTVVGSTDVIDDDIPAEDLTENMAERMPSTAPASQPRSVVASAMRAMIGRVA